MAIDPQEVIRLLDRIELIRAIRRNEKLGGYDQAAIMRLYGLADWPESRERMRAEICEIATQLAIVAVKHGLDSTPFDHVAAVGERYLEGIFLPSQTLRTCIAASSASPIDDSEWPTVSQAAREQGVGTDVITKAANCNALATNGKTGRARRINPASLVAWNLQRADGN